MFRTIQLSAAAALFSQSRIELLNGHIAALDEHIAQTRRR